MQHSFITTDVGSFTEVCKSENFLFLYRVSKRDPGMVNNE